MIKKWTAKIIKIQSCDNLNIVCFEVNENELTMLSLDLKKSLQVGSEVSLNIKPTSVAIAKHFNGELSYANQLKSKIMAIENGVLLSSITLNIGEINIESIITAESSQRMELTVGDEVIALIKANEISIAEVHR